MELSELELGSLYEVRAVQIHKGPQGISRESAKCKLQTLLVKLYIIQYESDNVLSII